MTNLWYIKHNDFLRFETLKCFAIVLKFAKYFVVKFYYFCWDLCDLLFTKNV